MAYTLTPNIKRAANIIVRRMGTITKDKFKFTYTFSPDGINFTTDDFFMYQDQGVNGTEVNKSITPFKYGAKMPPPSSFSKYSSDKSIQFAIAKSVQQKGIKAQDYIEDFERDTIIDDNLVTIFAEFIHQMSDTVLK